jgi:murein DD-endopeptidase MepM/ murein hydrolase activator NlpD
MIGALRVTGICAAAGLTWIVAASQVPSHERLALSAIVPGAVMTQPFGCSTLSLEPFDPYCPSRHFHSGVDLAAPEGTAVRAAAGGIVRVAHDSGGCGLYVTIVVDGHVRALYCHLSAALVSDSDHVITGQLIGEVGSTGLATGAHLHFEVQVDGRAVDPVVWLAS